MDMMSAGLPLTIVGEPCGVHDCLRAARGLRDRRGVEDVAAVGEVEAAHLVARARPACSMDGRTQPAAMAGEEDDQAYSPSSLLRRSSPPRTRRSPRTPRPASVFDDRACHRLGVTPRGE